ncbi:uncharacterized protein LOC128279137 [Anopheles cruzii]|uniref:uncharacterized protein LOC128279137 n=1 Tax=Anopheles cruzii TaxID=68878 RepID=UPI0022EC6445|nr:uncharacterized protein LOC128279137 [Anopheles cruzii]
MPRCLVLLCVVQCLLQAPLVLAKPDFGINFPITDSAKVSNAAISSNQVLLAVSFNTGLTTESGYPGLQPLVDLLRQIATGTVSIGSELTPLVVSLVANVSNDPESAFGPVFSKIHDVQQAINAQLLPATDAIYNLIGPPVPNQLIDGYTRISDGLADLASALQNLQDAIVAGITQAGSATALTEQLVKQFVKPALVYQVVFATNQLRAYIPVVKYTIDSTLEDISLADEYLLLVEDTVDAADTVNEGLIAGLGDITDQISETVETQLDSYTAQIGTITSTISNTDVLNALAGLSSGTGALSSSLYPAMEANLQALIDLIRNAVLGNGGSDVFSSGLLHDLILTLIENGGFAQFCFYKYYGLVFGSLTALADSIGQCFDKEAERLAYLRDLLPSLIELLHYDFEDVLSQYDVCTKLTAPADLNACIAVLSEYYPNIVTEFNHQMQSVFDLIRIETTASGVRFQICLSLLKLPEQQAEPSLSNAIRQCAIGGPTEDD